MLCLLFYQDAANGIGRKIRPVPWQDPDLLLTTLYAPDTPEARAWLEAYGNPSWHMEGNGKANALRLHRRLGYWPQPIDIEVEEFPLEPNDPIPFDNGSLSSSVEAAFFKFHKAA